MFLRALLLALLMTGTSLRAEELIVAESGGDFSSIQAALDAAPAGTTISVREKPIPYFEKLVFPRSGNVIDGFITLQAFPGDHPVVDGTGVPGSNMVLIDSRSYIKLIGFEIRNNLGVNDGSGVRILGSGSHIQIRNNRIHDIRGQHAMGITVYGTKSDPISDLVIDGNEIFDCEPFRSEALTLNGNVTGFQVMNNIVRDVNNIGIDFIGGETDIQPDPSKVARNGVCRRNQVYRANQKGGGFAGGIYVDGGRDIIIENNIVAESDLGIEVGAENNGTDAENIMVRSNLLYANKRVCIVFGGYQASVGRVTDSQFLNNTCYKNDTLGEGVGELWIQYASDNVVRNNIFYGTAQNILLYSENGNVNNRLDYNLFFTEAGGGAVEFAWKNTSYQGFDAYQTGSGEDANSLFADPAFVDPDSLDFHLGSTSPAIDGGDPNFVPDPNEVDLDGSLRQSGSRVDIGVDEASCGDGVLDPGEACDDGNLTDGDGCDSNCTGTGCGNGILTGGEDCDDGNLEEGDCCSSGCQFEPPGTQCNDEDPCTNFDACTEGICSGTSEPSQGCRVLSQTGRSQILLRDRTPDRSDRLIWKWKKGPASSLVDFGDPVNGSTTYSFCVYDDIGGEFRIALRATVPPGGTCGNKPCWSSLGDRGFRYKDKQLTPDGIDQIRLRMTSGGQASISLKAKGENLEMSTLPLQQDTRVVAELKNDEGVCWAAHYEAPALRNQTDEFKDKSD
jgi:cysteine-rich repeat protein